MIGLRRALPKLLTEPTAAKRPLEINVEPSERNPPRGEFSERNRDEGEGERLEN